MIIPIIDRLTIPVGIKSQSSHAIRPLVTYLASPRMLKKKTSMKMIEIAAATDSVEISPAYSEGIVDMTGASDLEYS